MGLNLVFRRESPMKLLYSLNALVFSLLLAQSSHAESIDDLINRGIPSSSDASMETTGNSGRTDGISSRSDSFRGQFRSVNYAMLSAGIAARVKALPVKTGSRVKKGQVLAEFDCSIVEVEQKITKARQQAAAESLEVNKRLNVLENISELELNLSASELAIAEAELERTNKILGECVILAPYSGTVTQKLVQAFEYVNVGDPIVEIIDTQNIEIEMVLPSLYLKNYETGATFSMKVDETGQLIQAKVERVVNVIDPVSQTVRIIGSLQEPSVGLMPGMSGQIVFSP